MWQRKTQSFIKVVLIALQYSFTLYNFECFSFSLCRKIEVVTLGLHTWLDLNTRYDLKEINSKRLECVNQRCISHKCKTTCFQVTGSRLREAMLPELRRPRDEKVLEQFLRPLNSENDWKPRKFFKALKGWQSGTCSVLAFVRVRICARVFMPDKKTS